MEAMSGNILKKVHLNAYDVLSDNGEGIICEDYWPKRDSKTFWYDRYKNCLEKIDNKLNTAITSFLLSAIVERCRNIFVLNKIQLLAQFWFDGII